MKENNITTAIEKYLKIQLQPSVVFDELDDGLILFYFYKQDGHVGVGFRSFSFLFFFSFFLLLQTKSYLKTMLRVI